MVELTELIAPSFYETHHAIKDSIYAHYWLEGGRGSTKSSFISLEIILGMMKDPNANAVVLRRVADTLQGSVYDQLLWAIDQLGLSHLWKESISPLRLTYIPTGQRIVFKGADKPRKIKSIKFRVGYAKFVWYEEVDEFGGAADIRNINQSIIRGGNDIKVFYSFNPPQSQNNWANAEIQQQKLRNDTYTSHTDYLNVPKHWLGKQFIADAEHLRAVNSKRYEHEYLGIVTGTGAEVFANIEQRVIEPIERAAFDKIYRGLDFGFGADPLVYLNMYYDSARKRLFIYDEVYKRSMKNAEAVAAIKEINPDNGYMTADSAEPRTISEFQGLGLHLSPAKKGPGSVDHGIKWLADLNSIIIDPITCPNTVREFAGYELERDKDDNLKGSYPDKDNHSIDATRYALENVMKNNKWLI